MVKISLGGDRLGMKVKHVIKCVALCTLFIPFICFRICNMGIILTPPPRAFLKNEA